MIHRTLAIDDDEVTLILSKYQLKQAAFCEHYVGLLSANAALEYLKELNSLQLYHEMPELIIVDINMPVMDAWQFIEAYEKEFGNKFPEIKIVILSSSVDPQDPIKARKYKSVIEFLSKPLNPAEIENLKYNKWLIKHFVPNFQAQIA
ncbi:response regulator [Limnovirga soli]|jgi:CheY-like chemotaxis protein|uniref:Response regulator n=1 Tax=Limnovirga soli TaxID=2656915 RepID=A0A8J8FH44_9BACT|nr:response regulator [Limnovirga soli]NNV54969.1 response regulator [Limnovirga soli]